MGCAITIKSFKIPFSPHLRAPMCFVHLVAWQGAQEEILVHSGPQQEEA